MVSTWMPSWTLPKMREALGRVKTATESLLEIPILCTNLEPVMDPVLSLEAYEKSNRTPIHYWVPGGSVVWSCQKNDLAFIIWGGNIPKTQATHLVSIPPEQAGTAHHVHGVPCPRQRHHHAVLCRPMLAAPRWATPAETRNPPPGDPSMKELGSRCTCLPKKNTSTQT